MNTKEDTARDSEGNSVQFSHSVVSDSLRPNRLQHARLPCPSPTPGAYSNSCPSHQWYHPTISSFAVILEPGKYGGGIGRGHHLLPHKFIKRSFECWATSTEQLLNTGGGHQAPRKAAHSLWKEVGQNIKDKKRNKIVRDRDQKEIRDMLLEIGGKGSLLPAGKKKNFIISYSYVESRTYKHMCWFWVSEHWEESISRLLQR